jgi:hypothetical protein
MIPEWKPIEEPPLIPKAVWYVAPVIVLAAAAGGYYYYTRNKTPPPPVVREAPPPAPVAVPAEPAIQNPVPQEPRAAEAALPSLEESDAALRGTLTPIVGAKTIDEFLVPENVVRNFVVTVDNLARPKAAAERRPIRRTPGTPQVSGEGEQLTLSEQNYARYAPFVSMVQSADARQLAGLYFRYYPLFQQAYEDLGYPDKYFNDRFVQVIDHLLETPAPTGPVRLTQPRVFYEYADPSLEERSAGQKLLIRMGNENATKIKAKLRELRALIATGKLPPSPER